MFNGLQEGIIVCSANKITFMNELSNMILSEITNLHNFMKSKNKQGQKVKEDLLDKKLFYMYIGAG